MANTYNRVNAASTTSGGGGTGNPFSQAFTVANWTGPVGGFYFITILENTHDKGTDPGVQLFELSGVDYIQVEVDRVRVNSSGDIEIRVPDSPDLRFNGKIVVTD